MRTALIWQNPSIPDGRILFESEPLSLIDAYRQDGSRKTEAGGILLGYRRDFHIHVTKVTVPQIADKRSRFGFSRARDFHQQQALLAWKTAKGTMDYLGEWHTHPESYPSPSTIDVFEWRRIVAARSQPMIFAILGLSGNIWLGLFANGQIVRCPMMDQS